MQHITQHVSPFRISVGSFSLFLMSGFVFGVFIAVVFHFEGDSSKHSSGT